jgi:hypothetical protein
MLKLKVPAVIAAMFFMSSVSAQAMEFADRPGPISAVLSSPSIVRAMPSADRSRRQIDNHVVLMPGTVTGMKLTDRLRPISSLIQARVAHVMFEDRPGRLSAEFSAVSSGSGIRFEHRPGVASNRFKPIATPTAMKFENRPGSISNRFKASIVSSKSEDRPGFTASLSKTTTPLEVHTRLSSGEFCVGSAAPCDPLRWSYSKLSYTRGLAAR